MCTAEMSLHGHDTFHSKICNASWPVMFSRGLAFNVSFHDKYRVEADYYHSSCHLHSCFATVDSSALHFCRQGEIFLS